MPIRIAFVSHSLPPEGDPDANVGGMQRVALELHRALERHPRVTYLPFVMRSSWANTHRRVVPFLVRTLVELRRLIRSNGVDAILFSSMVSGAPAILLSRTRRRHGVIASSIVHGLDVTKPVAAYQRFVPRVFASLDAVMPVSRATGAACRERGLPADKEFVVPNGVDVSRFSFPDAADLAERPIDRPSLRALFRRASSSAASSSVASSRVASSKTAADFAATGLAAGDTSLESARLVLCSLGRHVRRKGFAWFVSNVLPKLPDDVIYLLAGEGPETDNIRAAINEAHLNDRVVLLGRVSDEDLHRLYAGADLFVMPNIHVPGDMEGFGVVMLEAGLSGAPAIAAGIEGILDVIAEGENGLLLPSGDAQAFVDAIMPFYNDHGAVVAAAHRAREYTERTFSWDAVADRYVTTLESLVAGRATR